MLTNTAPSGPSPTVLRVVEFFSGIGGLVGGVSRVPSLPWLPLLTTPGPSHRRGQHYGLECALAAQTEYSLEMVAALDVNTHANACYAHNFGIAPRTTSIERLTLAELAAMRADMWLLSPPCQPFTQGGRREDERDARSAALLHLLHLLPQLPAPPTFLLVENVPNFEASQCRHRLVQTLQQMGGYEVDEFLLSPLAVGLPNDRKRYYLTARRTGSAEGASALQPLHHTFRSAEHSSWTPCAQAEPLATFLDPVPADAPPLAQPALLDEYRVPPSFLTNAHGYRFHILTPHSTTSTCMTKAYGSHHFRGSGSLLQTTPVIGPDDARAPGFLCQEPEELRPLGLRFLTPTEVARLHGFPVDDVVLAGHARCGLGPSSPERSTPLHAFTFPPALARMQRYRLLGNSLNVRVVAKLLQDLLPPGVPACSKEASSARV